MFIAALYTIARLWKKTIFFTTKKCIKKMWSLYIMEFYSTTKKNEIFSFSGEWNWRTSSDVKLSWFRRPNIACFLSYDSI
jgi:hypothetical protein